MDVTVKAPPEMKYDDGAKVQPRMLEITLRFDLTARNVAITGNKLPGIVEAAAAAGQQGGGQDAGHGHQGTSTGRHPHWSLLSRRSGQLPLEADSRVRDKY